MACYYGDQRRISTSHSACPLIGSDGTDTVEARRGLSDTCSAPVSISRRFLLSTPATIDPADDGFVTTRILNTNSGVIIKEEYATSRISWRSRETRLPSTSNRSCPNCTLPSDGLLAAGVFHLRPPLWTTPVACPFRNLPARSMGVRY